ncbi:hypothetical protein M569_03514 [Genlisea aurea]|uniref:Pectinesterase inhibitor domain-containing protein n=1 Tax=Genlisea aurea TaxID=192259 RepID=S8EFA4_9LAMI|nr:hypothetical protein M569_03514 [Genlisea aurea]
MNNIVPLIFSFIALRLLAPMIFASDSSDYYVSVSCNATLYPDLCFKSLSKYAASIKTEPKALANTALTLAFETTRLTLSELRKIGGGGESVGECIEVVGDSVYNLARSVRRMEGEETGSGLAAQMSDVETWVSAALTDDDTCMEDFCRRCGARTRAAVREMVFKVARLASIALTFIDRYASG